MSFFSKLFGRDKPAPEPAGDEPFMEHPSDDGLTAMEAMIGAFHRLSVGGYGGRWITFSGQGRDHREDSDYIEDVKVRGNTFDLRGQTLDIPALLQFAKLPDKTVVQIDPDGMVALPDATPEQMARFLDAVFQKHFGIHPHEGEEDYAVGAEW